MNAYTPIEPAELRWENAQPINTRHDDIYFSTDALGEVERVFLRPTKFAERLAGADSLTVAETGFGTGLNFIAAAITAQAAGKRLHFISVERQPLEPHDLLRALQPHAGSWAEDLARRYPPLLHGWHQRHFDGGIVLSLYFGDVGNFLRDLVERQQTGIDTWFLDGFAPSKNASMWTPALYEAMGQLSRPGARVATFTAAGAVRRGLESQGFDMRRVDQQPYKRESLAGTLQRHSGRGYAAPETVQVMGAGIAGCSLAAQLASRGVTVLLRDSAAQVATGSSQMLAMQHARLLGDGSPAAAWRAACYAFATPFTRDRAGVEPVGALQGIGPNLTEEKIARIAERYAPSGAWIQHLDHPSAEAVAGVPLPDSSYLWFPDAASVQLPELCRDLAHHPNITFEPGSQAESGLPTVWACGAQITGIEPFAELPVRRLWGQIDFFTSENPPGTAVLTNGYVVPTGSGLTIGSTYEYAPWPEVEATEANQTRFPGLQLTWQGRRRGERAVSKDRQPIVGRYADQWISGAHASMGATSAHLSAAMIVSDLLGHVGPIDADVEGVVDPLRFARRAASRSGAR